MDRRQTAPADFMPGVSLRVVEIQGDPWFVAKDVCDVLDTDTKDVRSNLDSDEVCAMSLGQRGRAPLLVNESGLYSLVLKSRKPEAKTFRKWVTSVVLPAIRKDGAYVMGEVVQAAPALPRTFADALRALADESERVAAQVVSVVRTAIDGLRMNSRVEHSDIAAILIGQSPPRTGPPRIET